MLTSEVKPEVSTCGVAASVEAPPYLAINESKASPLPAAAAVEPVEPVEVVAATAAAGEETARAAGATPVEEVTLWWKECYLWWQQQWWWWLKKYQHCQYQKQKEYRWIKVYQ